MGDYKYAVERGIDTSTQEESRFVQIDVETQADFAAITTLCKTMCGFLFTESRGFSLLIKGDRWGLLIVPNDLC